jgi:hypothetical protein
MTNRANRVLGATGLVLVCSFMAACGGSSAPAAPNPVTTPTPTPAPQPSPTPNPGSIGAYSCTLAPSSNPSAQVPGPNACPALKPRLSDAVNGAIDRVEHEHPELFNFNDLAGSSPRVLDQKKYLQFVAEDLVKSGVCTVIEKEEIAVKSTNDFNEQWNVYAAAGFVRRKYVTTCSPSWF